MSRTRADLVSKALDVLGISAVGQTVDADTAKIIDDDVDTVLKALAARELVYIPNPDAVPDEIFIQTAILLADSNKQNFGLQQDELDKLNAQVLQAESQIREIVRGRPTYERLRTEYY
jgi:hypothetical protein